MPLMLNTSCCFTQSEEFDEEEAEQLEAANEAEEDLLDNVGSAIGALYMAHP